MTDSAVIVNQTQKSLLPDTAADELTACESQEQLDEHNQVPFIPDFWNDSYVEILVNYTATGEIHEVPASKSYKTKSSESEKSSLGMKPPIPQELWSNSWTDFGLEYTETENGENPDNLNNTFGASEIVSTVQMPSFVHGEYDLANDSSPEYESTVDMDLPSQIIMDEQVPEIQQFWNDCLPMIEPNNYYDENNIPEFTNHDLTANSAYPEVRDRGDTTYSQQLTQYVQNEATFEENELDLNLRAQEVEIDTVNTDTNEDLLLQLVLDAQKPLTEEFYDECLLNMEIHCPRKGDDQSLDESQLADAALEEFFRNAQKPLTQEFWDECWLEMEQNLPSEVEAKPEMKTFLQRPDKAASISKSGCEGFNETRAECVALCLAKYRDTDKGLDPVKKYYQNEGNKLSVFHEYVKMRCPVLYYESLVANDTYFSTCEYNWILEFFYDYIIANFWNTGSSLKQLIANEIQSLKAENLGDNMEFKAIEYEELDWLENDISQGPDYVEPIDTLLDFENALAEITAIVCKGASEKEKEVKEAAQLKIHERITLEPRIPKSIDAADMRDIEHDGAEIRYPGPFVYESTGEELEIKDLMHLASFATAIPAVTKARSEIIPECASADLPKSPNDLKVEFVPEIPESLEVELMSRNPEHDTTDIEFEVPSEAQIACTMPEISKALTKSPSEVVCLEHDITNHIIDLRPRNMLWAEAEAEVEIYSAEATSFVYSPTSNNPYSHPLCYVPQNTASVSSSNGNTCPRPDVKDLLDRLRVYEENLQLSSLPDDATKQSMLKKCAGGLWNKITTIVKGFF